MASGQEFHHIIENIFHDVRGIGHSEQLQANCPKCQEREGLRRPDGKYNLEINTKKRVFRCWKCENPYFSGSLSRLIKRYGTKFDYDQYKSYTWIYDEYKAKDNIEEFIGLPEGMRNFFDLDENDQDAFEAYSYLVSRRNISRDILLKYRIGYCPENSGKYSKRIIIPSFDEYGDVNYFVSRYYGPKKKKIPPYLNPTANKNIIFNAGFLDWDSTIYIVEGVFDMLSFPINTTPILGKKIPESLYFKLKEKKPNVVVLLDPDAYSDAIDLIFKIQKAYVGEEEKVKIIELPQKLNMDIDEIRVNYGKQDMIKYIRNAKQLNVDDYFKKNIKNGYAFF